MITQIVSMPLMNFQSVFTISNLLCRAASLKMVEKPPSTSPTMMKNAINAPPMRTIVWMTSVQMTASMPPNTV